MAPAGGYKGVGSALLVEIFAACLAGANPGLVASPFSGTAGGPPGTGQFFIAIDPGPSSGGGFASRLATVTAAFAEGARLPGSRRLAARARADIDVDPATLAAVEKLAGLA